MLLLFWVFLATTVIAENDKRIVGGKEAQEHQFPWQAVLRWEVGVQKGALICGGSLIHPRFVLTAAHCFEHSRNKDYYHVLLGDHNRTFINNREQKRYIKTLHIHKMYNSPVANNNDLALIELETPATLNRYVGMVSLPSFLDFEHSGKLCIVSGWGADRVSHHSDVLRAIRVPVVSSRACRESYPRRLTGNMFCAGYADGSRDACTGDSGGPLVCQSAVNRKWALNGVISWGVGCGRAHKYGVYVRVRHYLPWIKSITHPIVTPPLPPSIPPPPPLSLPPPPPSLPPSPPPPPPPPPQHYKQHPPPPPHPYT